MTKSKKQIQSKKPKSANEFGFSLDAIIPEKYQLAVLLFVVLVIFMIFFNPLFFGGKTFFSGDIISTESMKTYIDKDRDGFTLWNPYVFCGMPAYALSVGFKWFNLIWVSLEAVKQTLLLPFSNDYVKWAFYLIAMAYSTFFFFYNRTKEKFLSLFVALAAGLSTGLVVFLYIGHVTKLTSLALYPIIFLMLFNLQKKIRVMDFFLLIIVLNLFVIGWHVQIIFYTLFAVAIYFVFYFIYSIVKKELQLRNQIIKSAVVFLFAMILAITIQIDNLTQVYEYTPASTRGTKSIVEEQTESKEKAESDFYQYATNWSFSPGEVLTFVVPSYYGFGKSIYQGPLSQNQPVEVNTYFGQMPFVDVAMYMGVIVFFLALFSVIANWKDPLVKFLTILSFIALLISFGRTFPILYDPMFYYFPFFDKFRVPSMILIIVQLSMPVLAGLGVLRILKLKEQPDKKVNSLVKYFSIAFTAVFILSFLLENSLKQWFIGRVVESGQRGQQLQPLHDYMAEMFTGDFKLAFFFSAAVFGTAWLFIKNRITRDLMISVIIIFTLIDLFRINYRGETYVEKSRLDEMFTKPDYISVIESLEDNSVYRILNLKQDGSMGSVNQNSNFHAYFLKQDLYGYSGIKPRAYQDYMDVMGGPANPTFWRMMNTKYIVFDSEVNMPGLELIYSGNKTFLYENKFVLPRAYFVDRVETQTGIEIVNAVKNNRFDPLNVAFITGETISVDKPDSTAFVEIISYEDEKITMNVKASGNNFLFLGDNYVPVGWTATIDGNETKIYKTNHGFRGIIVPEGEHKIVFSYLPDSFVMSKYISLTVSSLAFIGLFVGIYINRKKKTD